MGSGWAPRIDGLSTSLLPKKGDLVLLKNWRPAVLKFDYKVLSRALSRRTSLEIIVDCVHDGTIMDNIFLICDVIYVCQYYNVKLGKDVLDQEKAFDRVDDSYLFAALTAFGIGNGFLVWFGLLHTLWCSLYGETVKTGAGLSWPIPVK